MGDILTAFTRIVAGLVLITILVAVLMGIPILFVAACECVYCVVTGSAFSWTVPLILGVGAFFIVCLIVADVKL